MTSPETLAGKRSNGNGANTPTRKTTANNVQKPAITPNRTRSRKPPEPSLLQDFLLGRPSPNRVRRKSLDAVKKEMREDNVPKITQDRVKQWQNASSAAVVEPQSKADRNEIVVDYEESSADEELRKRVKYRQQKPGRRKSREDEDGGMDVERSKSTPRKRVISDDHWMKDKTKLAPKTTTTKKEQPAATLPKNFIKENAVNPPLERKIQDWVKRTEDLGQENEEPTAVRTPKRNTSRPQTPDHGIGLYPSRSTSPNDGIRVKPSGSAPKNSAIRSKLTSHLESLALPADKASRDNSPAAGMRGKPSQTMANQEGQKMARKSPKRVQSAGRASDGDFQGDIQIEPIRRAQNPARQSKMGPKVPEKESHLKPSPDIESRPRRNFSYETSTVGEELHSALDLEESEKRPGTPGSLPESLEDVPFGNSAFSVLEMPLGADAHTMRKTMRKPSKPQRNPSFRVPNVLKKVYTEGMKMMHDTVEPPTTGVKQPTSIESWLNNTTDPFIDQPGLREMRPDQSEEPRRMPSYKEDDQTERELTAERHTSHQRSTSKSHVDLCSPPLSNHDEVNMERPGRPRRVSKQTERASGEGDTPPMSPTGLRRSPATRISSSPSKDTKKVPFKEALMDAFRGESTTTRPKSTPFPLADIAGVREEESVPSVPDVRVSDYDRKATIDTQAPRGRKLPDIPQSDQCKEEQPLPQPPTHGRRPPPTHGNHCLSTIASVETFSTVLTATETASQLTETTVTHDTVVSVGSTERKSVRRKHSKSGSKKRLTKHSDLVSMLSLPDSAPPGRATSIRSARSVRTTRRRLDRATIEDVMHEVADDESKYTRELKTLVDGVIPVLLTSVLSKSKEAEAAGLFNPNTGTSDTVFTQPIVDMGVSLERLKSLHKRIPLTDPDAFIAWAHRAHKTYSDYIQAWRLGFQDVVVNLAPASRSSSAEEKPILEDVPRNEQGDVVNANGERVDVAFLLKRPMARIKYLAKATKGVAKLKPSNLGDKIASMYDDLLEQARQRTREEEANLEDRLASNIDPTRARDPRTMALVQDIKIDSTLKVMAKDYFSLMYQSSGGQRIECRVELFLRGAEGHMSKGDILICYVDDFSRYLLFPPIAKDQISARLDEETQHLIVIIQGPLNPEESSAAWHEQVDLEAEVYDTAAEWVDMVGVTTKIPSHDPTEASSTHAQQQYSNLRSEVKQTKLGNDGQASGDDIEMPIGARRRRAVRRTTNPLSQRNSFAEGDRPVAPSSPKKVYQGSESYETRDSPRARSPKINSRADDVTLTKPQSRSRYHSPGRQSPTQALPVPIKADSPRTSPNTPSSSVEDQKRHADLPFIPKIRNKTGGRDIETSESPEHEHPSAESKTPRTPQRRESRPSRSPPVHEDVAPPPPVHKTPPNVLKKSPYLETPTPKVRHRRTSSPLKHEYQPSNASGTSTESEGESSSMEDHETSEDSSDEELEAAEIPNPIPSATAVYSKQLSRSESLYSLPNATLAPSNSASQAPYKGVPTQRDSEQTKRVIATISNWSDKKGRWEDLWDGPCSVIISPGLIEAFEMSASHSSLNPGGMIVSSGSSEADGKPDAGAETPIIGQVLTPCVPLRQSTMIDIEIKSPPTSNSRVKSSSSVRYRALNTIACGEMYQAIHQARLDNIVYKRLEAERTLAGYGRNPYERVVQRRSWLFGRRKSYRAPSRESSAPNTPSADTSDELLSASPSTSAPSFLKRFSRGSFNIARSSVARNSGLPPGSGSLYTSSSSEGITPPRTPSTPSISLSGTGNSRWSFSGSTPVDLGSSNLKIRLYCLETASKWNDTGAARLTVTAPPSGMRAESSLYHGIERRVLLTRHTVEVDKLPDHSIQGINEDVIFDRILGGGCFSKIGRTGICVNVWADVRGPNGEVGMVGKVGGVSGTTRKWCFQTACSYDANWIYNLVAVGR